MTAAKPLEVFLPDTRGVSISRYGYGNLKIGLGVFTYSRLPGGAYHQGPLAGTCPGATRECEAICYAKRIGGPVLDLYFTNSQTDEVPPIPEQAELLRLHISGDFNSVEYINNWIARIGERPDVTVWAYTRSWRVDELLPALEVLRALPNVQLFASMDRTTAELPPAGWRRAWILPGGAVKEKRLLMKMPNWKNQQVLSDGAPVYVCPEETGDKPNCVECRYCLDGQKHDVAFLEHTVRRTP